MYWGCLHLCSHERLHGDSRTCLELRAFGLWPGLVAYLSPFPRLPTPATGTHVHTHTGRVHFLALRAGPWIQQV